MKVVDLKRSAEVVWSDEPDDEDEEDSGAVEDPNRPPRNAMMLMIQGLVYR